MKKSALDVQIEASKKFNPYTLKDFLTRVEDGTAIVDRSRLLKNKDDERLFYVILNRDYLWNYRYSDTATIYYVVKEGKIYGGVYELGVGCYSKRLIAEASNSHLVHHYIYSTNTLNAIIEAIHRATKRPHRGQNNEEKRI